MQIKRYEVASINQAMAKIRADLGPDAIILSATRLEGRSGIEVVAARDDAGDTLSRQVRGGSPDVFSLFVSEMDQLKALISTRDMSAQLKEVKEAMDTVSDVLGIGGTVGASPALSRVYRRLVSNGISKQRAAGLVKEAKQRLPEQSDDYDSALMVVRDIIRQSIAPSYRNNGKKKVVAFVGPTGAGKTTTLAKLAARHRFEEGLTVGIVTMDTYKVGAVAQLRKYSDILDIPIEIAPGLTDLRKALEKFSDRDIVFVDTPGKSRRDGEHLLRLKESLAAGFPIETNLVLSTTASQEHLIDTAQRFGVTGYDSIIFTKLDESDSFGSIYNVIDHVSKPVSYVTDGQNVPRDISRITPEKLAEMVVDGLVQ
ncbi:MAG: flagellar biosynthesis protein FlhF [Syntrophobacterales bacterium]|nr:MAG: flagellar biosynthesis protein FlhF [Syntrophobacterales bacterium]